MADGSLKLVVQAVIDEFLANIDRVAQETREVAGSVQESLLGMNEASKTATSEMVTSANQVADGTAAAWRRVAEASNEYKLAQREVRNASRDTTALAAGEEAAINRLALAKERLAAASSELNAAQKAAVVVNEEEAASFDLLGGAIGRLIEGALILEFVNHLKESALQAEHLASAAGLTVAQITQLKDAMGAAGVSTERLPQQLTHLAQQIAQAADGSKAAQHEFHQLGIETDGWKDKIPGVNEVLLQMSHHMQDGASGTRELAAASKLLGRNAFETIAFLQQGDEAIQRQTAVYHAHGQAVEDSVASAKEFQRTEEQVKVSLETALLPVFKLVTVALQAIVAGFYYAQAALEIFGREILLQAQQAYTALSGIGQAFTDVISRNFTKAAQDAKASVNEIIGADRIAAADVAQIWSDAQQKVDRIFAVLPEESKKANDDIVADADKASKSKEKIARDWLAKDNELLQKELDQHQKTQNKIYESDLAAFIHANDEKIKENNKVLADNLENSNAMLDDARAAAQGKLEIEKAELDFEVSLGKISNAQKYQQLQKYEADAYAAERQALLLKQGLYAQDEKEFARIGRQIQKLDDDFARHQIDNARKETLAKLQSFQQFFRQIDQNVKTSLAGWLQGTQSFSQAMQKLWQDIALSAFESLEQQGLNFLNKHIFMKAIAALFHIDLASLQETADAEELGREQVKTKGQIVLESEIAAATAYAANAAWPPLALLAATQAKSTVLAFAAFEKGGIVPSDQMAYVHKNEMVLPAAISQRLQTMTGAQAPAGGGGVVNFHYSPRVSTVDAAGFEEVMNRHADVAAKVFFRKFKKMGFQMA